MNPQPFNIRAEFANHYIKRTFTNVFYKCTLAAMFFTSVIFTITNTNIDNIIVEKHSGLIGSVIEIVRGEDGYTWYKVKLASAAIRWYGNATEGYVRRDVIKKI